ncbi:hexosaminidase D [Parasteatoda tepidariorum]|uniref:hexosaminidase D n=1 Tax=Parasteatoda tepidariorum TaxID=114398 RepID=UPI00077FB31D|nr:hexosaminidase D [Parasteatoda tepidariorum]XP_015925109.1 hexosaminidase D [Parasteatoda tepidariorum]XP_015925110.1 hexosaminidase D [Parasteatoda tepidariorum]XP_015925111.1 hexosaminidase D [Parasteatoda tepidariorum]XP_042903768.1 hexosaminidase D [Parasteatoda tepidariorum]
MFQSFAMNSKFRFYLILVASTSVIFVLLYKTLSSEDQDSESHSKYVHTDYKAPHLRSSKSGSLVNINDLLPVTQSLKHLERQRLKEAQVHANIKNSAYRSGIFNFNTADNLGGEEVEIDHPARSVNERVSKGSKTMKPEELININRKFVHLDLKGAPPIVNYYKNFFPLLHSLGANGLLIEYEDMFPFHGPLEQLSARNAYSKNELNEILYIAKLNELEVIPLIQTFGHMEFVLKLQAYQDLREVPVYPQVICPSNNKTQILLRQIVDQVVALHPHIKWLHIGSDEVYYIGECSLCQHKMRKHFMDKEDLFIYHVKNIAKYIKEKYNIQPIMWDDMFRMVPDEIIRKSEIWKYVELMAWQYSPSVEAKIQPDAWIKYGKYFTGVWAASAFKGATGANQYLTNISYHLENHVSWIDVLSKYQHDVPFKGFVLTGWQRYDHFAVLCELLPVSIPSLAVNLIYLEKQVVDNNLFQKVRDILMCDSRLTLQANYTVDETLCNYPGSNVFKGAQRLAHVSYMLQKFLSNSHFIGWMHEYNIQMLFSSPAHVELATQNLEALSTNVTLLHTFIQNTMPEVYDKHTIDEWLMTFVKPLVNQIEKIRTQANNLLKFRSWPRRPLSK